MSPLARMMAIDDVFEALAPAGCTRQRRSPSRCASCAIAKAQQYIDPDLFDLLPSNGVYLRYIPSALCGRSRLMRWMLGGMGGGAAGKREAA